MSDQSADLLFADFMSRYHAGESPELFDYLERAGDDADVLADMIEGALAEADSAPVGWRTKRQITHALKEADAEEAEDLSAWDELEEKKAPRENAMRWVAAGAAVMAAATPRFLKSARAIRRASLSVDLRSARRLRLYELLRRVKERK